MSVFPDVVIQGAVALLLFGFGFWAGAQAWHHTLTQFAGAFVTDPAVALSSLFWRPEVPSLSVDMAFEDYQYLVEGRERALTSGANLFSDTSYVSASASLDQGGAVPVLMGLLEAPAKDFEGARWPFQMAASGDELLGEMQRAMLTPSEGDSVLSWGYLEALRQADFVAPRYSLIHLVINGHPWGLYVMEELPSTTMAERAGRAPDVLIAFFDSRDFLEASALLGKLPAAEGFAYAQMDAARAVRLSREERLEALEGDTELAAARNEALALLRAVETGEKLPSEVFDPQQMGHFLALTAFWRGTSSLDWTSLSLLYDPAAHRFEPVGTGMTPRNETALPRFLLDDPEIQRVYIRELAKLSRDPALPEGGATSLEKLHLAVSSELGYPPSPEVLLSAHQAWARRLLAPAFILSAEAYEASGMLFLRLANVQTFPVEVLGLDLGEKAFVLLDPGWLAASDHGRVVAASEGVVLRAFSGDPESGVTLLIPLTALPAEATELRVVARPWGVTEGQSFVQVRDGFAPLGEAGR